jgi:large subunit ribosomal protein L19
MLIQAQSAAFTKARPDIRPGFTVRVHEKIKEGEKDRVQIFEGLVVSVHKGHSIADSTVTVRRIVSGVGVEKVFPIHSPNVEKIEVKKLAKVRRAKLFFLRGRHGKSARLSERFTTAGEFLVPGDEAPAEEAPVVEKE